MGTERSLLWEEWKLLPLLPPTIRRQTRGRCPQDPGAYWDESGKIKAEQVVFFVAQY